MYATREGDKITIHGNLGLDVSVTNGHVSAFAVTDPSGAAHLRSLWSSLGRLLREAEHEARGGEGEPAPVEQSMFEAYRQRSGGVSLVTGDPIPEWHEIGEDIQSFWRASAGAAGY